MNVRRFTARTSREALRQVREALGEDAVVLSTKPAGAGVEVLAMAPEGMRQVEQLAARRRCQQADRSESTFGESTFGESTLGESSSAGRPSSRTCRACR